VANNSTDETGDDEQGYSGEEDQPGVQGAAAAEGAADQEAGEDDGEQAPADPAGETARLLDHIRLGDEQARSRLIAHACERLRRLTSHMLRHHADVRRWEQTDDVLQNALIRLCRALAAATPESPRHFYRLAAVQIRRELIDLFHHHLGPQGHGAKHDTGVHSKDSQEGSVATQPDRAEEPSSLGEWTDFHRAVESLPDEEREIIDLLWYEGLTQEQAAAVLGVSLRTVRRRWQSARLKLTEALHGEMPSYRPSRN
jgi:RNA polymerase sigma factor (sigma-70 family)